LHFFLDVFFLSREVAKRGHPDAEMLDRLVRGEGSEGFSIEGNAISGDTFSSLHVHAHDFGLSGLY
jgi:hypothetical protein